MSSAPSYVIEFTSLLIFGAHATILVAIGGTVGAHVRWLRLLANEGLVLVAQEAGAADPNSTTAALTDKGRIALDAYFRAAGP